MYDTNLCLAPYLIVLLLAVADEGGNLIVIFCRQEPEVGAPPAPGLGYLQRPGLVVAGVGHHQAENTNILLSGSQCGLTNWSSRHLNIITDISLVRLVRWWMGLWLFDI